MSIASSKRTAPNGHRCANAAGGHASRAAPSMRKTGIGPTAGADRSLAACPPHRLQKGTGTVEWLTAQGMTIGSDSNMAYRQADGSLAARPGADGDLPDRQASRAKPTLIDRLNGAWNWGSEKTRASSSAIRCRAPKKPLLVSWSRAGRRRPCSRRCAASISGLTSSNRVQIAQTSVGEDQRHPDPRLFRRACPPITC